MKYNFEVLLERLNRARELLLQGKTDLAVTAINEAYDMVRLLEITESSKDFLIER